MAKSAFWSLVRFFITPLCDNGIPRMSMTKLLCAAGFGFLWHAVEANHPISGVELAFYTVIMAAAFGKSTFTFFLSKKKEEVPT